MPDFELAPKKFIDMFGTLMLASTKSPTLWVLRGTTAIPPTCWSPAPDFSAWRETCANKCHRRSMTSGRPGRSLVWDITPQRPNRSNSRKRKLIGGINPCHGCLAWFSSMRTPAWLDSCIIVYTFWILLELYGFCWDFCVPRCSWATVVLAEVLVQALN